MSDSLTTRTLADLYLSQGYGTEARDAYVILLNRFPGDEGLKPGLAKAQALVTASKKTDVSLRVNEWTAWVRQGEEEDAP